VHGGQQPVSAAALHLYAANATAYAGANTDLLTTAVSTGTDGSFNITNKYACTAGQQMYIVAIGGNPGGPQVNPQIGLMAALGDCANLNGNTVIQINEVTTVASVFALAPFMASYTQIGAPASNAAGLANAFRNVNKLASIPTGSSPGPLLAPGATAPVKNIYSIANALAACVNSTGGTTTGTTCGNIFALATPVGGTLPSETIGLALMLARNPTLNVTQVFNYGASTPPFAGLTTAPADWTLGISYGTGFNAPQSTTVDANNQVWVANSAGNSVTVLGQNGSIVRTLTGNGLNGPVAVAIDASGDGFVANKGGTTVSAFTGGGGIVGTSPFTVGTAPSWPAFDATGHLFVANSTGNSVTELTSAGALVRTLSTGVSAPTAVIINAK